MKTIAKQETFHSVLLVLALLILTLNLVHNAKSTIYYANLSENYPTVIQPLVILENDTNNVSHVYLSNTSAKISITATSSSTNSDYSLKIVNNNASHWEVKLECYDYADLTHINTTIILRNDSFSLWQIKIEGGNKSQNDTYYDLADNAIIHIGVQNLIGVSSGTTVLHTHLKIKIPNRTTYMLYEITFEFKYDT
jgi:hypothetical protein